MSWSKLYYYILDIDGWILCYQWKTINGDYKPEGMFKSLAMENASLSAYVPLRAAA